MLRVTVALSVPVRGKTMVRLRFSEVRLRCAFSLHGSISSQVAVSWSRLVDELLRVVANVCPSPGRLSLSRIFLRKVLTLRAHTRVVCRNLLVSCTLGFQVILNVVL